MEQSPTFSRRGFVKLGISAAAVAPFAGLTTSARAEAAKAADPWLGLKVGVASYTFSRLPLDATIEGIRRVGVHYVSIKEAHLPLKSSTAERKAVAGKFLSAGITPVSCGVVTMKDDESAIRNAFEYARDAGIPTIVASPARAALPILDRLVKEFDIKVAIHNHGPEDKVWPSPFDVWEEVRKYDDRIGLCIDVGHTARCGVDPAGAIEKTSKRLYDLHIKDIASRDGKSQPVEVGRGVLDIAAILRALLETEYAYHVGLEYEKDMKDPLAGVAESIGFIRGRLAGIKA